ncbi:MAG: phenylacetate--CoA ligase family protein [Gemmatimonadota bacterium]
MSDSSRSNTSQVEFRYLLEQVWGEPRDLKLGREEMAARRDERVRSIVRFAFECVPWYGRAMRERGLVPEDFQSADDLALLPIVGHEELASDSDAFLPRGAKPEELLELRTSSSTMTARRVYHDPEGIVAGWAVKLRERAIRERLIGERRYRSASLSLDGNPTRVRDYFRVIAPAVWKLVPEGRKFSVFEDSARVVEGVREWRPLHLSGYGSALGRLFRYLTESGESMPLPRVVTFSSDAMSAMERRMIEKDFGIPVLGIYSATEAFSIGFECAEGEGYHVNEDVSFIRIVDAEGRNVEPGVTGSVVVSNLVNRGTVLLNYRLGDIGSPIDGVCPCGRPLPRMRLLEGRDTIYIARADGLPLHQYRLFLALNAAGISRWQVVQTSLQTFVVRVIPAPGQDRPKVESEIRTAMVDLLGPGLDIAIEYPPDLERTKTGKVLSIIRR